ncbi:hypothetical protein ACPA9J_28445 [Pseudomonas aeruginosa]
MRPSPPGHLVQPGAAVPGDRQPRRDGDARTTSTCILVRGADPGQRRRRGGEQTSDDPLSRSTPSARCPCGCWSMRRS